MIGLTYALALGGVTDFSFVQEDDLWRGSEVHRIIELLAKQTLDRKSVPKELAGYLAAFESFTRETSFVPLEIEKRVECKTLGIRGRMDFSGLLHGRKTVLEVKTGEIAPAAALQTALYGHLLDKAIWWNRAGLRVFPDGSYKMKVWRLMQWPEDLSTALSVVRIAKWKIANGLAPS